MELVTHQANVNVMLGMMGIGATVCVPEEQETSAILTATALFLRVETRTVFATRVTPAPIVLSSVLEVQVMFALETEYAWMTVLVYAILVGLE